MSDDWPVKYPYRYFCPYCEARLKPYRIEIQIEYEIPIYPPAGARDLGLKEIITKEDQKTYFVCPKCDAKYTLDIGRRLQFVEEVPNRDTFIRDISPKWARILKAETKHYGLNPNYENPDYSKYVPGECFIATSVYGSPHALEVRILRKFRDEFLLKSMGGKIFVSFYYCFSPRLVRCLKNKKRIKIFIKKVILDPLVILVTCVSGVRKEEKK